MLLYKSHSILKKLIKISTQLNLQQNIFAVVTFVEGKILENRVIFNIININDTKENNIIYDNLKYICGELNIKIEPDEIEVIRDLLFNFDFERDIYKVYYVTRENNKLNKVVKNPTINYRIIKSNKRDYYDDTYKRYKTKRNIEKYKFMKKYGDIINYRDYEYYLEKKRNKKIVAVLLKIQYNEDIDKKKLIKGLFSNFNINDNIYNIFIEKYVNKQIQYIGFSENRVSLYLL